MYIETYNTEEEVVEILKTKKDVFRIKVFFSESTSLYHLVFENIDREGTGNDLPDDAVSLEIVDSDGTQDDSETSTDQSEKDEPSNDSCDSIDGSELHDVDSTFGVVESDESLDIVQEAVLPLQYSDSNLRKMMSYHLSSFTNISANKCMECERFDLESMLYDYQPDLYNGFKNRLLSIHKNKLLESSKSNRAADMDNNLSNTFYEIVCTKVVVSDTKKTWYYKNGIWKCSSNDKFLWNVLNTAFLKALEEEGDFDSCVSYLGSYSSRKKVMADTKLKLLYQDFEKHIDSNKNIIGMKDGIMEINTGIHRGPRVSDLVSKSTHIEYVSMEDRKVNKLRNILRKVFPDADLLRFFIRSCSTFLEGYNSKKVFYVWWGTGNNCKTGMSTLVQSALGDYCGTAPVSLITGRRTGSSEATPELCHMEGKLVVFLQEPNLGEKLKAGRIKELTGNDKIYIRELYSIPREIDVKCKLVHICNFPTAGSNVDAAFKRRVVVLKFTSTFVDEDEYQQHIDNGTLNSNIFRIDERVEDYLRTLGDTFLGILIREYKVFKEVGLQIPEIVRKNTQEFLTYSNLSLKYIRGNLVRSNSPSVLLTSSDIYDSFKYWIRNLYPSYNAPSHEVFTKELNDEGFIEDDKGVIRNAMISDRNVAIDIGI